MAIAIIMMIGFCIGMAALFVAALTGEQDYRAKMQIKERRMASATPALAANRARAAGNVHFLALK